MIQAIAYYLETACTKDRIPIFKAEKSALVLVLTQADWTVKITPAGLPHSSN